MKPYNRILSAISFLLLYLQVDAQSKPACDSLRMGIFYYYPVVGDNYFTFVRDSNTQTEIEFPSGDSAVWQIDWRDGCTYTLTYLSSSGRFAAAARSLNGKLQVDVHIIKTTSEYYVYQTKANKRTHAIATADTLWFREQPEKLNRSGYIDPIFPGGAEGWKQYLQDGLSKYDKQLSHLKEERTCLISFVIDVDGSVTDVKAVSKHGSKLEKFAVELIRNSPKWTPGIVNKQPAKMPRLQPVTFAPAASSVPF